jgi:hypothetical protein
VGHGSAQRLNYDRLIDLSILSLIGRSIKGLGWW